VNPPVSIVWFRQDLRLADNSALQAAVNCGAVVPVFIYAPEEEAPWQPGSASKWWLHRTLRALESNLREYGVRRYEPAIIVRDAKVKEALRSDGVKVESFNAALLHEPWMIRNKSDKPFQVFTPFWKSCLSKSDPAEPLPAPKKITAPAKWPKSLILEELELEPKISWAEGLRGAWQPGEAGASINLKKFLSQAFADYSEKRNRPDITGTSRLSPHLHFGEISPRQIWRGLSALAANRGLAVAAWRNSQFLAEVGWREFAHHLLFHFPHTPAEPLRPPFKKFPWHKDAALLRAWQKGRTGYPIVDAGMSELWTTGWMHNRVRMIVASFLVKDLLLPWQDGARWFWDTLVDADLAQNTLGWQWAAGCGADAAPYFRIFNPVSQGEKFDPNGDYVRHWCPQLAKLPPQWIHQPHAAPQQILRAAGVELGRTYPKPVVNHPAARAAALAAFAQIKSGVVDARSPGNHEAGCSKKLLFASGPGLG